MTTSGLGLSIAVLAFGASTIYLAVQLSEERAHSEQLADETRALNARIAELEKARAEPRLAVSGTSAVRRHQHGAWQDRERLTAAASRPRPKRNAHSVEAVLVNGPSMQPRSEAFRKMMRSQMRAKTSDCTPTSALNWV